MASQESIEKRRASLKKYRLEHPELYREASRRYYAKNREKRKAESRAYWKNIPKDVRKRKQRAANLGRYGVTPEWYDQKLSEQNDCCALCGRGPTGRNQYGPVRLSVDHNHDTGKARGLLCFHCNTSLHRVEYIPGWTQKATDYLKRYD